MQTVIAKQKIMNIAPENSEFSADRFRDQCLILRTQILTVDSKLIEFFTKNSLVIGQYKIQIDQYRQHVTAGGVYDLIKLKRSVELWEQEFNEEFGFIKRFLNNLLDLADKCSSKFENVLKLTDMVANVNTDNLSNALKQKYLLDQETRELNRQIINLNSSTTILIAIEYGLSNEQLSYPNRKIINVTNFRLNMDMRLINIVDRYKIINTANADNDDTYIEDEYVSIITDWKPSYPKMTYGLEEDSKEGVRNFLDTDMDNKYLDSKSMAAAAAATPTTEDSKENLQRIATEIIDINQRLSQLDANVLSNEDKFSNLNSQLTLYTGEIQTLTRNWGDFQSHGKHLDESIETLRAQCTKNNENVLQQIYAMDKRLTAEIQAKSNDIELEKKTNKDNIAEINDNLETLNNDLQKTRDEHNEQIKNKLTEFEKNKSTFMKQIDDVVLKSDLNVQDLDVLNQTVTKLESEIKVLMALNDKLDNYITKQTLVLTLLERSSSVNQRELFEILKNIFSETDEDKIQTLLRKFENIISQHNEFPKRKKPSDDSTIQISKSSRIK